MASDGNNFTLVIPSKNLAIEGANTVTDKNPKSPLLNLRPDFFLDAITVRGLNPDDEYMVVNDTETVEDLAKKHLYIEPEYELSVMRPKAGREITPVRVITFHRDDMLPTVRTSTIAKAISKPRSPTVTMPIHGRQVPLPRDHQAPERRNSTGAHRRST